MAAKLKTRHLTELIAIADPRLAPTAGGERPARALATVTDVVPGEDKDPPRYRSRLALVDLAAEAEGPRLRTLTFGEQDRAPRWSPDGRHIAFLRGGRDAKGAPVPARLAVLDLDGGEARVLTEGPNPVTAFAWRDDAHLLIVTRGDRKDESVERGLGRVVDRRWHRLDGVGFLPDPEADLVQIALADGAARKLATLPYAPDEIAVAPGGRRLAFLAPADAAEYDAGIERLWTLRLGRKRADAPEDLLGVTLRGGNLAWSPDGARLAFLAPSDLTGFGRSTSLWLSRRGSRRAAPADRSGPRAQRGGRRRRPPRRLPDRAALEPGRPHAHGAAQPGRPQPAGARGPRAHPRRGAPRRRRPGGQRLRRARRLGPAGGRDADGAGRAVPARARRRRDPSHRPQRRPHGALPARRSGRAALHDGRRQRAGVPVVGAGEAAPRPRRRRPGPRRPPHQRRLGLPLRVPAARGGGLRGRVAQPARQLLVRRGARDRHAARYGTVDADDVLAVVDDALAHHERPDAPCT
jgi:dipeptidyl aminopeptidase/acylaminoacyl peptidase